MPNITEEMHSLQSKLYDHDVGRGEAGLFKALCDKYIAHLGPHPPTTV